MKKKAIETYDEAVDYLLNIPRFSKKNTPTDTGVFLKRLGNPEKGQKIIHVAGTNGKGSVCAYMEAVLTAAGYRVMRFTSPHLKDIRERFCICGKMVDKEVFLRSFLTVYNEIFRDYEEAEGYHPSFFEYLFFMAMVMFKEAGGDYWILETGLGGRLDATNAVTEKKLTVITHMGLDHTEYLGDTIEKITREKAGIMKEGVPVVAWKTDDAVAEVLTNCAEKKQIPALLVSKCDYEFLKKDNKSIDFSFHSLYYSNVRLSLKTQAVYQMENATLSLRALEVLLGDKLTPAVMKEGIRNAFWEGRMEEILPGMYVDGAHNPDGIRAFLQSVSLDGMEERHLFYAVVKEKDDTGMVREIVESGLFTSFSVIRMHGERALAPQSIADTFQRFSPKETDIYDSVEEALQAAKMLLTDTDKKVRIYFAGSLYLVGEIKALL